MNVVLIFVNQRNQTIVPLHLEVCLSEGGQVGPRVRNHANGD